MDSRLASSEIARPSRFALGLAWRAAAVAALAFGAIQLIVNTHFYATAFIVAAVAALVTADVAKLIARADRSAQHDFERLAVVGSDVPFARLAVGPESARPFDRVARILNAARAERQQQLVYLQTLLDTVAAALIVTDSDGRIALANQAARALAHDSVDGLMQQLSGLPVGARRIVSLTEGQRVLVSISQFGIPGQTPRRLISVQRIAGELDAVELKAWQDMADVLTHEMMNSLTPIASLSESLETLLRERDQSGEVASALEAIKRRSRGLMDFVERYRSVAELPAPSMSRVRMEEFLRGIDQLLGPVLKEKGVSYRSSVTPGELACLADPQLLEQAVINLLRNAADAVTGSENPRVEVTCELRAGLVVLAISDNGCGVPDARREQIFVPFFTTKAGGSGIGLNLARHVALGHGGQLEMRSNVPRGSIFELTLPAAAP